MRIITTNQKHQITSQSRLPANLLAEQVVWEDFQKPVADRECSYKLTENHQGWTTLVLVDNQPIEVAVLAARVVSG